MIVGFKDHTDLQKIQEVIDEDILLEMSVWEDKYPNGTEIVVSTAGSKTLDIPKGTVLSKAAPGGQYRTIKIGKGGFAVYVMHGDQKIEIDGSKSGLKGMFNKPRKSDKSINWNANTLETAACLGLYDDFDDMFNKLLDEDTPPEYEKECVERIMKSLSKSPDFDSKGVAEIKGQLEKGASPADVIETVRLAAGTTRFMSQIKGGNKFKHICHDSIKDYYAAEESNEKIQKSGSKDATPDAVFMTQDVSTFLRAMASNEVTYNDKTGICEVDGIQFILASLKKAQGQAQLGKIYSGLKARYGLADTKDLMAIAIAEGWFSDKFKALGAKAKEVTVSMVGKAKELYNKVKGRIGQYNTTLKNKIGDFINKNQQKHFDQLMKKSGIPLKEARGPSIIDQIDAWTAADCATVLTHIEDDVKALNQTGSKNDYVVVVDEGKVDTKGMSLDDKCKLFVNYQSTQTLLAMMNQKALSSPKNLAAEIIDLLKEMYFGKTDLPVFKVFGAKGESDTTWEYLKSASEFKQEKLDKILEKKPQMIGVKIDAKRTKKYYSMTSHFIMDVDGDTGQLKYTQNRMGTNHQDSIQYAFEGYKVINADKFNKFYGIS